jgi:hypothetical protein
MEMFRSMGGFRGRIADDCGLSPFQLAMLETAMEDAAGKPCMACGKPGEMVAVWIPTATCLARDFGVTDGR